MTAPNCTFSPRVDGLLLISYVTPVAFFKDGILYRTEQRYSVTTTRHIGRFAKHCGYPEQRVVSQAEINRLACHR